MERQVGSSTDTGTCDHCGQPLHGGGVNRGLEQFLGKVGISDDMINNLKTQFQNVDVEAAPLNVTWCSLFRNKSPAL